MTTRPHNPFSYRLMASAIAAAFAAPCVTPVAAQDSTDDSSAAVLEEVLVTAQRRQESSQDIAMALRVLDGSLIGEQRIQGIADVAEQVPSLDIFRGNGSNNPTITLRGIGTTNPWVNNNPSVAAHMDEVYLPMSAYLNFPIFDLERIEVLKGPQVGLYGRNATAGAINFVTRRPEEEFSALVDLSYGSFDAVDLEAAVGGSLGASLQGRIAVLYRDGGGWMDRPGTIGTTAGFTRVPGVIPPVPAVPAEEDYGDREISAVRGALTFTPNDAFTATLSVHYAQDNSEIIGSTAITSDALGVFTPPSDAPWVDYDNVAPINDSEQIGGFLDLRYRTGSIEWVSLTGVEQLERQYAIGDFVPTRIAEASFDEDLDSFFQEFRADYTSDNGLRWLTGVTYTEDEIDYARVLSGFDLLLGALGTAFVQEDEAWAVFTQVELPIGEQFALNGSLRYTDEEKTYDGGSFEIDPFGTSVVGVVFPNVRPDGLFDRNTYTDDDLSGRVAFDWTPSDNQLYYVSVARAFKSGGFDGSGITEPESFLPFGPETVWAYEGGAKLTALDGRMRFAGSLFYYDYEDKQVLSLQDLGGGIVEAVIQNAAESEVTGIDLELDWLLAESLTLRLAGTWLDSEVTDWNSADPAEVADRLGNELPATPELSWYAGLDWQQPVGAYTLGAQLWATYTDEAFRDIENTEALLSDDFTVVNARVSLALEGNWSFYVFARNLFDDDYVTSRRALVGMLGEYYGPPRTYGIGLRYEVF